MSQNLSDIRNYLFDVAESKWWLSIYLTLGMQFILLIAVFWNHPVIIYISGFTGLVVPLAVTCLRVWASSFSSKGDKCRRLILYSDGLGENIPPEEISTVRGWAIGANLGSAPFTPLFMNQH